MDLFNRMRGRLYAAFKIKGDEEDREWTVHYSANFLHSGKGEAPTFEEALSLAEAAYLRSWANADDYRQHAEWHNQQPKFRPIDTELPEPEHQETRRVLTVGYIGCVPVRQTIYRRLNSPPDELIKVEQPDGTWYALDEPQACIRTHYWQWNSRTRRPESWSYDQVIHSGSFASTNSNYRPTYPRRSRRKIRGTEVQLTRMGANSWRGGRHVITYHWFGWHAEDQQWSASGENPGQALKNLRHGKCEWTNGLRRKSDKHRRSLKSWKTNRAPRPSVSVGVNIRWTKRLPGSSGRSGVPTVG